MNKQRSIAECREQIQEDLRCFLDGMREDLLDQICDIVVENFKSLTDKLGDTESYGLTDANTNQLSEVSRRPLTSETIK